MYTTVTKVTGGFRAFIKTPVQGKVDDWVAQSAAPESLEDAVTRAKKWSKECDIRFVPMRN